jgi:DNA-binding PadR family transcriptional regulator
MKLITRKEELVMLSILNLEEKAYLIAIQEHLSRVMGRSESLTSVHLPLSRLEKGGLIASRLGNATAVRGGRRKKIYYLTKEGLEALQAYKRISDDLWDGLINNVT